MNKTGNEKSHIIIVNSNILPGGQKQAEIMVGKRKVKLQVLNYKSRSEPRLANVPGTFLPGSMLPDDYLLNYQVMKVDPLKIKLGPILGILTTVKRDRREGMPTGREAWLFKKMITYARQRGIFAYIFYRKGINWTDNLIEGYTLTGKKGRWVRGDYPMPDIVYNRIRYRYIESNPSVQSVLKEFEHDSTIHFFNTRFLDKSEVYRVLAQNPRLIEVLPPTTTFTRSNLNKFLRKYREVFLKPSNNSRGRGIIKIIKKHAHKYMYARTNRRQPAWSSCFSTDELYRAVRSLVFDKSRYLLQKGIDLASINGHVFDLRVQVQKGKSEEWVLTGIAVRVAACRQFVTHIPNGGTPRVYTEVVKHVFGDSPAVWKYFDNQLSNICQEVPTTLEKELGWSLAILTIDIGIDQKGKMWVIEVNSKPASFDEPEIREKHLQYFMDYCLYLFNQ